MTTLLQRRDRARVQRRRDLYDETRRHLRACLAELIPGHPILVFGSLTKPGAFNDASDIDLALETEPAGKSPLIFAAALGHRRRHLDRSP